MKSLAYEKSVYVFYFCDNAALFLLEAGLMYDTDGLLYMHFLSENDQNSLVTLFDKYRDGLTLFIYGIVQNSDEAEELMMDTFAILVSGTARYKEKDGASFKTWLYAIAKKQALLYLRKRKIRFIFSNNDVLCNLEADSSCQPVARLLKNESDALLYRAMEKIDSGYRQALYLLYFEGMKPEQISLIIKKNIKQTYNLLARGKESLRAMYERMGKTCNLLAT